MRLQARTEKTLTFTVFTKEKRKIFSAELRAIKLVFRLMMYALFCVVRQRVVVNPFWIS